MLRYNKLTGTKWKMATWAEANFLIKVFFANVWLAVAAVTLSGCKSYVWFGN